MLIKNKKRREPILPYYAYVPIITVFVFNMLVFYGTKLILKDAQTHDLRFSWDYAIPFVPFFIVFYILAYVQWALGYLFTGRESREVCYRVVMSDLLAKFICMIFFLVLPTETTRPEVTGSGLFASLTRLIYAADTPVNLFPSIHCLESWICFRGAFCICLHGVCQTALFGGYCCGGCGGGTVLVSDQKAPAVEVS